MSLASRRILPTALVVLAVVPLLYTAVPLVHLFTGLRWPQLQAAATDREVQAALATSVGAALITTASALVFGVPTAYLLASRRFFGKRVVEAVLLLPLLLPPVVGGIGELYLYGPESAFGGWLAGRGLPLTNSFAGVVLAQLYITCPFLILAARAGFEEVPSELREATHTLGGGAWHVFWYVSLPLARRAIAAGALLTFARAMGEFGATMMMAYHPYTVPVDLWVQFTAGGMSEIVPLAALVTLLAVVVALVSGSSGRKARA
ncbi:MAG: ABC transporter permease [Alicyclobacillus sp.]|nr:ABC transporter permease [Alicyclobacillus sp.]